MEEDETTNSLMNENLITSFVEITSSSRGEATFFLESHRWDLDAAVSAFLDNDAADLPTGPNPNLPPPSIPAASPSQSHSPDYSPSETSPSPPSRDAPYRLRSKGAASENQGADNPSGSRNTRSRQHAGNIRTFADLNRSQADGADCDSDDGQEYYTGRQKSGMMVQDPKEAKDVDALFEQARQSAVDRPDEPSRSASTSFTGASRLLSGVPVPSAPQQQQQDQPQVVTHGPLRSFGDPENATFLESIALTECPRELEPVDRKVRAHVDLVRGEDNYTEPQASPAQMNTAPALSRWEAIRALRQLNLNPERPDSGFLKTLDTSSKKTTKVLKHLKEMDEEELLETIDDLRGVKVRPSEAVYAICQATILSSNVQAAAQICSLLHQRHKEFSPCLKQSLLKVFSPGNSDWMKKSSNLLLLLLLYYVGVIEDCHIFVNVIEDLTSVEQLRDRAMIPHNVTMLVDFAEHGRVFLGLPFSGQYEDFFKGLDVTAELENSCKMAFNTYYAALADLLRCEHKLLDQMDKENAKMELSGDNASSHEKLKKSCYDLYCYLSTLAESLDMQPPAKDGTITESVDMQPSAKDFTTWLAKVWPNHLIPIDLRPSVQADLSGEAASTSDKQSAKEKENTSEAYTVPLPLDVMTKILSRCEVEDLVRFRTVNKEISAYNYELLKHQALEFFIRVDNNHTVQIMNPGTRVLHELETPLEFRGAGAVSSMVHCKGLVLCSFMDAKLAIWNPILIEARWINPPSGGFTDFDFYGVGYDKESPDSYKVLRFIHRKQFQNSGFYGKSDDVQQAEIYEFRTDSWKTVESKRDWMIESWCKGLCINGSMYWVAWRPLQESSKPLAFILSFDFSTDEFKSIVECPNNGEGKLRLGSFERDRLSLIQQSVSTGEIEVWVTESNLGSFTRKFTISGIIPNLHLKKPFCPFHPVYTLGKNNGIMAWCLNGNGIEGGSLVCHSFLFRELYEKGGVSFESKIVNRNEDGDDRNDTLNVGYLYFPSLAPLPTVGSTPPTL